MGNEQHKEYNVVSQYQDVALEFVETGEFTLPDPGSYIIKFLGCVDTKQWPRTDNDGNELYDDEGNRLMDTSLTLQFIIDDPEDEFHGIEFRDYYPLRVTTGNKSGKLWAAFLGVPVTDLPTPLPRIASFAGKRAQANLGHRLAGNGKTYLKIESVVPLKKKRARPVEVDEEEQF